MQLGVIADFRTEAPLDITANGRDLNGDGITGDWANEALCLQRTGVPACPGFNYTRNSVRELSAEDANALRALFGAGVGGPLAPVAAYANNPKYFNTDLTLQKRFRFGGQGIRLTAEAFNVFNIAQRTAPNQGILSPLFGTYTAVESPRSLQFTFQFDF